MATKTLQNVKIQHKTKTSAEWLAFTEAPLKGELCVELNVNEAGSAVSTKIKIGDGKNQFKDLAYVGGNDASDAHVIETAVLDKGADHLAVINALTAGLELHAGDIAIAKEKIDDDGAKVAHTAYVFDGEAWKALDGNYSAENVYFTDDLIYTANIGTYTVPSSGSGTISAKGKNLKEVLSGMLAKENTNFTVNQPTLSLNSSNIGSYEVGTNVALNYSFATGAGSYQYGPATGVTFSNFEATFNGETKTGSSGTFTTYQITDTTSLVISGGADYSEGAVPVTNLGNPRPDKRIAAGTKQATKGTLTGYRKSFYGTLTDKALESTSAVIRNLVGKSNAALANGSTFNITVPVGATSVIFAYPATLRDVTEVIDVNGMNANVASAFVKSNVEVLGANEYQGIAYKVYRTDFANPVDTANTYKVKI